MRFSQRAESAKLNRVIRFLLLFWAIALSVNIQAAPTTLTVSAAASVKNVLTELGASYEKSNSDVDLKFNFASSGTLQRQIEQGAPVDIFIAAANKNVAELVAQKLVVPGSRRVLAGNQLVLIVSKNSDLAIKSFRDAAKNDVTIAVGAPSVPAGQRAQEVFEKLGLWPQIQAKAVRGKDVREVLTQVELGNVDCGVVYRTDAAVSAKTRLVAVAPASFHKPIRYPAIVTTWSENPGAAKEFLEFLASEKSKPVWKKYRFLVK